MFDGAVGVSTFNIYLSGKILIPRPYRERFRDITLLESVGKGQCGIATGTARFNVSFRQT